MQTTITTNIATWLATNENSTLPKPQPETAHVKSHNQTKPPKDAHQTERDARPDTARLDTAQDNKAKRDKTMGNNTYQNKIVKETTRHDMTRKGRPKRHWMYRTAKSKRGTSIICKFRKKVTRITTIWKYCQHLFAHYAACVKRLKWSKSWCQKPSTHKPTQYCVTKANQCRQKP